jgi:hypothetical protein
MMQSSRKCQKLLVELDDEPQQQQQIPLLLHSIHLTLDLSSGMPKIMVMHQDYRHAPMFGFLAEHLLCC